MLTVLASALFSSCKKDSSDDVTPGNTEKTGVFTCKNNGVTWESDAASKQIFFMDTMVPSVSVYVEADTMTVMAFRTNATDSTMILMNVQLSSARVGSYTMSGQDNGIYFFPGISPLAIFATALGYTSTSTLNITKYDAVNKKISGTFTATMTPTSSGTPINITEGKFTDVSLEIE